jgi:lipopolysaccharide transport system ATP-binding protein
MRNEVVIRVENLWKQYRYGTINHATIRKDLQSWWAKVRGKTDPNLSVDHIPLTKNKEPRTKNVEREADDRFWALQDVSFEVKQGEVLGIIGRNGAGKSTLLKIMSRVTTPTKGEIKINGRVASLLEVGTGFHPELTGRENIFLNGAILGMSKKEIRNKFDEIVSFAEVEKFIDTPVKRYSSGMYVRLAFAVAAHLEPEILIVDEVLAVGDAQFQKKCLGKMGEVAKEGRTVLFVSHNMGAVQQLCVRTILLNAGLIKFDGDTKSGIDCYLRDAEKYIEAFDFSALKRLGTGEVKLTGFSLKNLSGEDIRSAACGEDLVLVFHYELSTDRLVRNVSVGFSIHNTMGETLSILYSHYNGSTFSGIPSRGRFECRIKDFPYSEGRYFIGGRIVVNGIESDWPQGYIGCIDVEGGDFYKIGGMFYGPFGAVLIKGDWQLKG